MGKKKRIFFLPLMFIGMGVGFILIDYLGGEAFVASMFIGMGIGFLLDSLFSVEEREIVFEKPYKLSSLSLMIIGLIMILGGGLYLVNPTLLESIKQILIGLVIIAVGLFILTSGYKLYISK